MRKRFHRLADCCNSQCAKATEPLPVTASPGRSCDRLGGAPSVRSAQDRTVRRQCINDRTPCENRIGELPLPALTRLFLHIVFHGFLSLPCAIATSVMAMSLRCRALSAAAEEERGRAYPSRITLLRSCSENTPGGAGCDRRSLFPGAIGPGRNCFRGWRWAGAPPLAEPRVCRARPGTTRPTRCSRLDSRSGVTRP